MSPSPGTWFISMLAAIMCVVLACLCAGMVDGTYACMHACMCKHVDLWANDEEGDE